MAKWPTTAASLRMFQEYHWIMLRAFYDVSVERFGAAGEQAVARGIRACGYFRGQQLRDAPVAFVSGRGVTALIENWDTAEWDLGHTDGQLQIHGSTNEFWTTLDAAPGSDYLMRYGDSPALELYWPQLLDGICAGYDPACRVEVLPNQPDGGWRLRWADAGSGSAPAPVEVKLGRCLEDPVALVAKTRVASGLLAAFQMYVSRELHRSFDADGEEAVRAAAYQFGAERGSAIREHHQASGIPINLASFGSSEGLQARDPDEAVFVFRGEQHLSPGAYYMDCTYCPLQEVWAQEGAEGLRLGYLFDASNHRGLFQSYHPETVIRWDSVKSRGDSVCKFRFTIPSLLTDDDPTPEQFDQLQQRAAGHEPDIGSI
jgi:hypothetical protein